MIVLIQELICRIWEKFWISDKLSYLKASILNTALGISVIYGLYAVSKDRQLAIFGANFLGYFISIINYKNIGFHHRGKPPYFNYGVVYLSTFALNLFLASTFMAFYANFYVAQVFVVPIVAIFQWLALNFWVFK